MIERFDKEAARAAGESEHGLAETRIQDGDHEAHHGVRLVEVAGIARGGPPGLKLWGARGYPSHHEYAG